MRDLKSNFFFAIFGFGFGGGGFTAGGFGLGGCDGKDEVFGIVEGGDIGIGEGIFSSRQQ